MSININIPNIEGNNLDIIEILVDIGDTITEGDSLIVLENDKTSIDIPSTHSGIIEYILVKVGDKVSTGSPMIILKKELTKNNIPNAQQKEKPANLNTQDNLQVDLVILGSGPGGYTAAFRAADLGLKVILIEKHAKIGGVCLNVGCIPSKCLLHLSQVINETSAMKEHGVVFTSPKIDLNKIRKFKESIVNKLTGGLKFLAKQRKVNIIQGLGEFISDKMMMVKSSDKTQIINFKNAIIAVGSSPVKLPFIDYSDPRIIDSTGALELKEIPKRMLVVGGGIIGLEMAQVYHSLGTEITIIELADSIIPNTDKDIITPLMNNISNKYKNIYLSSKFNKISPSKYGVEAFFTNNKNLKSEIFDIILVAVGRVPNGKLIKAEKAGVKVDQRGFIKVNRQQQTNVKNIFAIGDVVGEPMLAHKATHEAKVAAEVIAGQKASFNAMVIPSVAYTDPEVAFVGISEEQAKKQNIAIKKGVFPWAASGRSLSLGRTEGITKTIFDKKTGRIIGAAITGPNAGELIAEVALAIEMGADATDISATIHPHPTLSETIAFSAEMIEGTITDLMPAKTNK